MTEDEYRWLTNEYRTIRRRALVRIAGGCLAVALLLVLAATIR